VVGLYAWSLHQYFDTKLGDKTVEVPFVLEQVQEESRPPGTSLREKMP